jgi:CheY-like chemotaxis protein
MQRRRRILVIEDHRETADTLGQLLELLGHEVRIAYSGPDGVRAADAYHPEVVLSDIGLPGLDGYGVALALRQNPATAHVLLVATTAYGTDADRRRARDAGFDHHLTKPFDLPPLLQILAAD